MPSKLTVDFYKYYLGSDSKPEQNRQFQAYWMQLETEWLRSNTNAAGVLAFCYLANNYGYTGDWFIDNIRDLRPSPTLDWFQHAFAPVATFINLTDERYTKHIVSHQPGSELVFNLSGINNRVTEISGLTKLKLINLQGKPVYEKSIPVKLAAVGRTDIPVAINLPADAGGYLLIAEFSDGKAKPVISRRYIKVGQAETYNYFEMKPQPLK
jgi:hypothetical protein